MINITKVEKIMKAFEKGQYNDYELSNNYCILTIKQKGKSLEYECPDCGFHCEAKTEKELDEKSNHNCVVIKMDDEQKFWEGQIKDKVDKILNTLSYGELDKELQKIMDFHCIN